MSGHTPTPWRLGASVSIKVDTQWIADCYNPSSAVNAAFIVRAVNAHDNLVAALKEAQQWLPPNGKTGAIIAAALAKAAQS